MENLSPQEITDQIWNILLSMQDQGDDPLFIQNKSYRSHSYLGLSFIDFDSEPITYEEAYNQILPAVEQSLKNHQKVFLYYCPDNAEISIEQLREDEDEEELELFDKEAENFYIGKD